ncbi:MAG: DUF6326 family protein [Candidatus Hodarchaeota archaeon]
MEDVKIILSGLWVATMLTYLLGDVLRIFAGDMISGEIGGVQATQKMWMGAALLMLIPIVMVFLSLTLQDPVNRWTNIIAAIFLFVVNIVGVPGYPGVYDKFLIIVSLGFNVLTVWYAWNWV